MNKSELIRKVYAFIYRFSESGDMEVVIVKEKPGMWSMPGGKMDEGEEEMEALQRELKEELLLDPGDYHVYPTDVSVAYKHRNPSDPRYGMNGVIQLYSIRLRGGARLEFSSEIQGVEWVKWEEAIERMYFKEHAELVRQGGEFVFKNKH